MSLGKVLLRARHMGVRDLRNHLSRTIKGDRMVVVTEHGQPSKVLVSYEDMLEIVDIVDELQDERSVVAVHKAKKAIEAGTPGIPVAQSFKKLRTR